MITLTTKQNELYEFICQYIKENKYSPSVDDMGKALGITRYGAYDRLKKLVKYGVVSIHGVRQITVKVDHEDITIHDFKGKRKNKKIT